ncbi:MAG: hypothetical protein ABIY47_15460 [Opitutaceae bacterium]
MITPQQVVSALAVATRKGTAKWLRDEMTDGALCVLPNEIVRLTIQRVAGNPSEIESMWLLLRGVQLLYLPGSDAGQILLALAAEAEDDREALANAKRVVIDQVMKVLGERTEDLRS